jgi:hypothetical protein
VSRMPAGTLSALQVAELAGTPYAGLSPAPELLESRIARLSCEFALRLSDDLLSLLAAMSAGLEELEPGQSWAVRRPDGMMVGVARQNPDPLSTAISVAIALFGMAWPFLLPNLLKRTGECWKEIRDARRETEGA